MLELPPEWELRECKDYPGRVYYYNVNTHQSTWIRPFPFTDPNQPWPPLIYLTQITIQGHNSSSLKMLEQLRHDLEKGSVKLGDFHSDSFLITRRWIRRSMLPPEVEEKAWKLDIGTYSEPFEFAEGWCLLFRDE